MHAKRLVRTGLAALLLALPLPGAAQETGLRGEMEGLEAILDRAVSQVSRARVGLVLGRESSRGYRLQGYGAVFVLAPRSLPRERKALVPGEGGGPVRPRRAAEDRQLQIIVAEVEAFQRAAEQERAEAEERFETIVRQVRVRLAPPAAPPVPPPAAPAPVAAPAPPPHPEAAPAAVPEPPPPPPWHFWFEVGEQEDQRPPARVISDVRGAVTRALESPAARLRALNPEEYLVVAVDFVPGSIFAGNARPEHTLVVRVRSKDVEQRQAGRLAPEEFRRRIEYIEY